MTPRQTLAKIRKLLASPDREAIRYGFELISSLDDPEVLRVLSAGLSVDSDGLIHARAGEIGKRVKSAHRAWATVGLLRATGGLDAVETLRIHAYEQDALEFLSDMPALRSLSVECCGPETLSALAAMPGLRALELRSASEIVDLSPLAGASQLEVLELGGTRAPDLSPLAQMSALRRLVIDSGRATDLSPLAGLTGLTALSLADLWVADLSPLAGLTGLTALSLADLRAAEFSAIAGLTGLTELRLAGLYGLEDLTALSGMTGLVALRLHDNARLQEIAPLSGLPALRVVDLSRTPVVSLAPLAGAAIEELALANCRELTDLSPLAGCTGLRRLDLDGCRGVHDLGPLRGLRRLRRLGLWGCPAARDLSPLRGLVSLADDLSVNAEGQIVRNELPIYGLGLRVVLTASPELAPEHPIRAATAMNITGQDGVTALPELAGFPALRSLSLSRCGALETLWPIVALDALEALDLEGCEALRPQPRQPLMEGWAEVERYRRRVAAALADLAARSPAEDALLERARELGLLAAPASERPPPASPEMIRRLLCAAEVERVVQGVRLLKEREDPALAQALTEGIALPKRGVVEISRAARDRMYMYEPERRSWTALSLLWAAGRLDGAKKLTYVTETADLSFLEGLTGLQELKIMFWKDADLSPLAGLSGLRALRLVGSSTLTDLSAIAGLADLERLDLSGNRALGDLSVLLGLPALQLVDLRRCVALPRTLQRRHRGAAMVAALKEQIAEM